VYPQIQVAAKHHMLMMAYSHDATKRTVASLETDLENSTQQLQVKTLELKVAKSEQLRLKVRSCGVIVGADSELAALVSDRRDRNRLPTKAGGRLGAV
jgi:hypothetical protein